MYDDDFYYVPGALVIVLLILLVSFGALIYLNREVPNPHPTSDTMVIQKVFVSDSSNLLIVNASGNLVNEYYEDGVKFVYDVPVNQNDFIIETATGLRGSKPVFSAEVHLHSSSEMTPGATPDHIVKGVNYGGKPLSNPESGQ